MFLNSLAPAGDVLIPVGGWASVVEAATLHLGCRGGGPPPPGAPLPLGLGKGILLLPLIPIKGPPLLNVDAALALCD